MTEPQYRLEGIVHTRSEQMEDFEGPLDVIFELLSKNKIEIQDVSITAILEQYLAYLEEMKRLEGYPLPHDLDYLSIHGLRMEARQKLQEIRPTSLGQASRVSGVSPADVAVLMVYLKK